MSIVSKIWEGQTLQEKAAVDPNASWFTRHRRLIAFVAPATIANIIWWSYAASNPSTFDLFNDTTGAKDTPNWYMCVTMVFGSMIAGATSEGGAAVAFPVMTIAFGILPSVARDFSFMIQSAGMTSAAATIALMRVQVEMHSLLWSTLGGICGIVLGLEQVAPRLSPPYSKMYFVCTWAAFAFSLFWLNRYYGRRVFEAIPRWEEGVLWKREICVRGGTTTTDVKSGDSKRKDLALAITLNWKACVVFTCGFIGGIFSAISGSGIDICTFSVLTLLFRVSEKIATPTSVVLMAINTLVGFIYRQLAMGGVETEAVRFFTVCVPIVVIGAPLGSLLGSHFHRLVLASFVYVTDGVQFIGALAVVQPWSTLKTDTPRHLCLTSFAIIIGGGAVFSGLAKGGHYLLRKLEEQEKVELAASGQHGESKVNYWTIEGTV